MQSDEIVKMISAKYKNDPAVLPGSFLTGADYIRALT